MTQKRYPLHPGQEYPRPFYSCVPMEDYEALKKKLDAAQKECIRIVELYRNDHEQFEHEIDRILNKFENPVMAEYIDRMTMLENENRTLKEMNAKLQEQLLKV